MICHYWFFNHGFKFQNYVCNGCHDLTKLCLNISNIAIITLKLKSLQKDIEDELMLIVWHYRRWGNFCIKEDGRNFCIKEDEKKMNRTRFYRVIILVCFSMIQLGYIEAFCRKDLI